MRDPWWGWWPGWALTEVGGGLFQGPPPGWGMPGGNLKESCTRFPPLLRGVREEREGCLSGQVARVGARSDLVARWPPRRRGVRHQNF